MPDNILWYPTQESMKNSIIAQFMQAVNRRFSKNLTDYQGLYQWSIDNLADFWSFWAEYCKFPFMEPPSSIVSQLGKMETSQWFSGAKTNYVAKISTFTGSQPSLIAHCERGIRREISRDQLNNMVTKAVASLRSNDITKGDRIAAYMPNTVETVVLFLACATVGAIWSSCSPDFGIQGVMDRFGQIKPRLFLTVDGYHYSGKLHKTGNKILAIASGIPSIEKIIIVPFSGDNFDKTSFSKTGQPKNVTWNEFLTEGNLKHNTDITPVDFNHPLYILYSSGTTGVPKCIVHGHGGSLLQHMKEHQLHTNIKENDRVFYFTTCGWMMWNWLVSVLASGACAILYDGSPFHPGPEKLWELTEQENINVFGTSAKYLSALNKEKYYPEKLHNLNSVDTVLSTGSPLAPGDFDFVYQHIKKNICLSSISGGTDIVSCFVLGSPVLPVHRGQIQCRGLGMDVAFVDDYGQPHTGVKGELVCKQTFPSMPVCFWNDEQNEKYHKAYFDRFDNIWAHGDYGELTPQGGIILHGRSDTTLNPGGVRIGTAEIYRQVEKLEEVKESLAVGQKWCGDERIILFVILETDVTLDQSLENKIKSIIRKNTTPRHVPAKLIQVTNFPRTRSGKVSEIAIKAVIHGESVKNTSALANADVLKIFKELPALRS